MIRRWSALIDQPSSMKRAARWSSSSGWVGGSLRRPKSPGVATRGVPKWCIQTRLTRARAVSGLSRQAIARASSSRPLPSRNGFRSAPDSTARNRRGTGSPRLLGLPRRKTRGSTGVGASSRLIARGGAPGPVVSHFCTAFRSSWSLACEGRSGKSPRSPKGHDDIGRAVRAVEHLAQRLQSRHGKRLRRPPVERRAVAAVLPELLDLVQQLTVDPRRLGQRSRRLRGQGMHDQGIDRSSTPVLICAPEPAASRAIKLAAWFANSRSGRAASACHGAKTGSCPLRVRAR